MGKNEKLERYILVKSDTLGRRGSICYWGGLDDDRAYDFHIPTDDFFFAVSFSSIEEAEQVLASMPPASPYRIIPVSSLVDLHYQHSAMVLINELEQAKAIGAGTDWPRDKDWRDIAVKAIAGAIREAAEHEREQCARCLEDEASSRSDMKERQTLWRAASTIRERSEPAVPMF